MTSTSGSRPDQETLRKAADPTRVGRWLADQLGDPGQQDCQLHSVSHGQSNITFRVDTTVLRRPPVGSMTATAHDMGRERRGISALIGTTVPVPAMLAWAQGDAEDPGPVDAPCYVMELIDVLVALHAVDPEQIGLGDFGRPDGFMARQRRRWSTQWDTWQVGNGTDDATAAQLTRLAGNLAAALPEPGRTAVALGHHVMREELG